MLYRIVIEAHGDDPQALKEQLAMALERARPAKVVAVEPLEQQMEMRAGDKYLRQIYLKKRALTAAAGYGSRRR